MAEPEGQPTGKRPLTPLWIIALFVSLTETVLGIALTQSTGGVRIALTSFAIVFPLLTAGAFFGILWFRPWVLFSPLEYGPHTDVGKYVGAMRESISKELVLDKIEEKILLTISSKLEEIMRTTPTVETVEVDATRKELTAEVAQAFQVLRAKAAPSEITYDWGPFIRRIAELEGQHRFLSVKWLNEKKLIEHPGVQEALQVALTNGVLETYYVDNPKNKEFPVRACRLNRANPIVAKNLLTRE